MIRFLLRFSWAVIIIAFWYSAIAQDTWVRAYGAYGIDRGEVIRVFQDKDLLVAGNTGSFGNGNADILIMRLDTLGNLRWSSIVGDSQVDEVKDMRILSSGEIILAGFTNSSGQGGYDGLLIKLDDSGTVLWQRTFGALDWDLFNSVEEMSNGDILVAGTTYSFGGSKAWLLRTNSTGDTLWTRRYGGNSITEGLSARQTTDGGYIIGGLRSSATSEEDALLIKVDPALGVDWDFTFGGDSLDKAYDVIQTADGGYSAVGITHSFSAWEEAYHFKVNAVGTLLWEQNWGQIEDQAAYEHHELPNGEYISIGYARTSGAGGQDMFLLKSDSNGGFVFGRTFGGAADDVGLGLDYWPGGFTLCGTTTSSLNGIKDILVVRTDTSGFVDSNVIVDQFLPLSVADRDAEGQLFVYPNPSFGKVHVQSDFGTRQAILYDEHGAEIWQSNRDFSFGADLSLDVPAGTYLMTFFGFDGMQRSFPIIFQ